MAKLLLYGLSSFVVGLAVGLWVSSAALWAWLPGAEEASPEAVYQGRPTRFWIAQLQDHDPALRHLAVQALEQIGPQEAAVVPALASMLEDRQASVRMGAAIALRRLGPAAAAAAPALLSALHDDSDYVRFNAVCAMAEISRHDEAVSEALLGMLQDPKRWCGPRPSRSSQTSPRIRKPPSRPSRRHWQMMRPRCVRRRTRRYRS